MRGGSCSVLKMKYGETSTRSSANWMPASSVPMSLLLPMTAAEFGPMILMRSMGENIRFSTFNSCPSASSGW